jgi:hypothetical protein
MKIVDRFVDPGLYLGVLNQLMERGALDDTRCASALDAARDEVRADPSFWADDEFEYENDNDYRAIRVLVRHLGSVDVTETELAGIDALHFEGGSALYMWIEEALGVALELEYPGLDTGGESDTYDVLSLEGVEALHALRDLRLDCYAARVQEPYYSLAPLRRLAALEELYLNTRVTDPDALLDCAALTRVTSPAFARLDPGIADALRARGVEVVGG